MPLRPIGCLVTIGRSSDSILLALHGAGAGRDRDPARQRDRLERRRRSRRDRDRARGANEHEPDSNHQRSRQLHFLQPAKRHLYRECRDPGLQEGGRPNVKVEVNTTVRVDMKLEVGQINETLTVSAESPCCRRTD